MMLIWETEIAYVPLSVYCNYTAIGLRFQVSDVFIAKFNCAMQLKMFAHSHFHIRYFLRRSGLPYQLHVLRLNVSLSGHMFSPWCRLPVSTAEHRKLHLWFRLRTSEWWVHFSFRVWLSRWELHPQTGGWIEREIVFINIINIDSIK